ncbi:MAG: capsule-associated protein CAP1 [Thelocarpon superellum]|nr:MAG: capsule-associated protein CAP1 [Thelocarpon superellum]
MPALVERDMASGGTVAGFNASTTDDFHRLVEELSKTLGPSSGLTTAGVDVDHLTWCMKKYCSNPNHWERYAFADTSRGYTRNLVDRGNGKSNLLILVWTPGKGSPVHDHADAHCLMKVLKGSLKETLYDWPDRDAVRRGQASPLTVRRETVFGENEVTYMSDDLGLHRISNPHASDVAVSLHLYTPPNAARLGCHLYDEQTGKPSHTLQCHFYSELGVKLLLLVVILSFITLTIWQLRRQESLPDLPDLPDLHHLPNLPNLPNLPELPIHLHNPLTHPSVDPFLATADPLGPDTHPIHRLVVEAQHGFEAVKSRQSQTLADAVADYRRRYQIPPPPNFDKWFKFAKKRKVQLIDEYDTIHHSLLPFWGLEPATIRARTREALGFDNALMGVSIRGGNITLIQGGQEWQQKATMGMMESFITRLPDMDLAFNVHDEPRVVVPYEDLSRLVKHAQNEQMPSALANAHLQNYFSPRPKDLNDGMQTQEYKTTRFNRYAHQPTWEVSKLSCSPDTPARSLEDEAPDDVWKYATTELGFVFNSTAFSDVCHSPSLRETYGFFDRPNAFDVVHDLFPIFSQSKVSSFQDILYPSPWYWDGKVVYEDEKDLAWDRKVDRMYWRGSTTGGFSRDGGWRRQHRQKLVKQVNALDKAKVLQKTTGQTEAGWQVKETNRQEYRPLFNVSFSHVGQCDPNDCDAQREFFTIAPEADRQEAWKYRYLLDMDGNAFSGRFYAFLHSHSLVYKMAVFREWHQEWLQPWLHYVPLSLRGGDLVESVRYFAEEDQGKKQAPFLAEQGREWAQKVLRNEDFEVWLYRLLLE